MLLLLNPDGVASLEQAGDFSRFHLEIDAAFGTIESADAHLVPLAQIESREIAWVDREALFALGCAQAHDAAAWTAQAQAMLDKAARYGWLRDQTPSIKSHIVWRA
jgi:hypothetical protein